MLHGQVVAKLYQNSKVVVSLLFPKPTNQRESYSPTPSTHNVKMDLRSKGWVPNNIIKKISIQNSNYTQEYKYLCGKPFHFEGENYETNFESILLLSNQITIILVYVS